MKSVSLSTRPMRRPDVLLVAFLGACTLAIFSRACQNDFVNWDDGVYVTDNAHIQEGVNADSFRWAWSSTTTGNWHPLTWLSLQLDWQLYGPRPWGFHLTNVLLHVANTALLFLLLRWTTGCRWPSAVAAALFALHPLHVESVAWVSERKDVLSTLLWLLTMLAYVRYTHAPSTARFLGLVIVYAAGLMAKPMLVTLPFVLLLFDYWPLRRTVQKKVEGGRWRVDGGPHTTVPVSFHRSPSTLHLFWEKIPLLLLSAVSCALTLYAQSSEGAVIPAARLPLDERLANALVTAVTYLGRTFWPLQLAAHYPHPRSASVSAMVLGSAALLAAVSVLAVALRRRCPYLPVGWFWYLGTLVPVIGLVQVGEQAGADRYTYVPLIGIFIAVSWGMRDVAFGFRAGRVTAAVLATAALVWFALLAVVQLGYWRDSATLWRHTLQVTGDNALASYMLGLTLVNENRLPEAVELFEKAVAINPGFESAQNNLGVALTQLGRAAEAVEHFQHVLKTDPANPEAHNNLGRAYEQLGKSQEAIREYLLAVDSSPQFALAQYNLGSSLARLGRVQEGVEHLIAAVTIAPSLEIGRIELGERLVELGRLDEAEAQFQEALQGRLSPARAQDGLGVICCLQGRRREAIDSFREAVRLEPATARFHYNLGHALLAQNDRPGALAHYQRGLQLDPSWPGEASREAWTLATAADAAGRNGALAVRLAEQACEAADYERAEYLDALAAAYAEAGRFSDAVDAARRALTAISRPDADRVGLRARLQLYEKGQPYRQPKTIHSSSAP
jgi:tetratricopeptide (TPR) repeat protein